MGQLVGPIFVGAVWDATSVLVAFLTAAGFVFVSAVVFVLMCTRNADTEASSATPGD